MATTLTHRLEYDAPLADVAAMLADPAFREEVCAYQRVLRSSVTVDVDGGITTVVVEQAQPANGIPGFARKFVGDEIDIVQREEWSSPEAADLHVTIPGKPGQMVGTITLEESAGRTTETVDVRIKVNIPLVAGKLEELIAGLLRKALVAEGKVGRDYLSR
ncbi:MULTISPECIES: DUF2505 domain-containing protein [unclassified Nocardioides]|jgi:hypothetical protein|uniref:DUF2505 domain-containing protein n=1 Tax=Nocardioides sp. URHA0032 TaxID=1380388 RepID=UPI0012DBD285|nr:DUF2505 domain-containing protein [Nocardioides sp. URHA0032]